MRTMEEIVLDRLIEEVVRPLRIELEQIRKELATTKQTLRYREEGLAREVAIRQKLQNEALAAEKPLTDLFHAAEKVLRLNGTNRPRGELREAISQLGSAMCVAEKYIDQIPF